jgi:hypothetical protein
VTALPDCKACKENRLATEPIPYIAHEAALARLERTIKKLWVLLILLISLLVATNVVWIVYENQYADESWTYEASTDGGGTAIANGDGEVSIYGDSESNSSQTIP